MKKVGWLKNSIAKSHGLFSASGEKLKGVKFTDEMIAAWNGVKAKVAAVEQKIEDTLDVEINVFTDAKEEPQVEETPKVETPKPKSKGWSRKK
tara:strand:+ start:9768 stop:10046 length:279 start_codon:yes stop_codon:yes gene_type:complete